MKFFAYLQLIRPANVITAIADIIAGAAIAGFFISGWNREAIIMLLLSTIGLYAGGVVLNDYYDAELDAIERPERPIPSGKVSKKNAFILSACLFSLGIISAMNVGWLSGGIAVIIVVLVYLYDKFAKHEKYWGPLTMGLCRAGNLILGISIIPGEVLKLWWIGILPLLFISAVTLTSQGETSGKNKKAIISAIILDCLVFGILIILGIQNLLTLESFLPFGILWIFINVIAKIKAVLDNTPQKVMQAVKTGVLSLIILDASYAAGFGHLILGIAVILLLPFSILLAKTFAVT